MDLSTLFGQWLHGTPMFDYAVGKVQRRQEGEGWVTRVQVVRKGDGMIPVDVAVIAEHDTAMVRTDGDGTEGLGGGDDALASRRKCSSTPPCARTTGTC